MNIAEQVKDALKEEIIAAVVKAGLADEKPGAGCSFGSAKRQNSR